MTRIFSEGAEMGSLTNFSWDDFNFVTNQKRSGNYSFYPRIADGLDKYSSGYFWVTSSELYIRYAVRNEEFSRAQATFRSSIREGGTQLVSAYWSSGSFKYYVGTSQVKSSGYSLSNNTWYLIETHFKLHETEGKIEIKVNGTLIGSYTGNTIYSGNTTGNNVYLHLNSYSVRDAYMDDIAINDTSGTEDNSWCGDGHIIRLSPNANGDNSDFKGNDGDYTDNYLLVDDRPHDGDSTFVVGENVGDYDLYNFAASGLPAEQVIKRVWVEATAKDPESGNVSLLVKSGTTLSEDSADQTLGSSYGRIRSDDYTTNPDTGAEWTEAELDAIQAGMKVKS